MLWPKLQHVAMQLSWALVMAVATGCSAPPLGPDICQRPESDEPTVFNGGTTVDGVYMSAAWDAELLHYPGGAYYEFPHELGGAPTNVQFFLSFERFGLPEGSLAPAAGNQVEIKAIDDESLVIVNGTCSEYYLLAIFSRPSGA